MLAFLCVLIVRFLLSGCLLLVSSVCWLDSSVFWGKFVSCLVSFSVCFRWWFVGIILVMSLIVSVFCALIVWLVSMRLRVWFWLMMCGSCCVLLLMSGMF